MRSFVLAGPEAVLQLKGALPEVSAPYFGWDYFAELRGHALEVNIAVADDDPSSFAEYFESLANDWRGWTHARCYQSLDGTLALAATHDGVGGARFEVTLKSDGRTGFDWTACHRVTVELGQLPALAATAKGFTA